MEKKDILFSWTFDDKKERGKLWYIMALSITIGLSIWGLLTHQYGMSFIILLIAGLTYYIDINSDDQIKVTLTNLGITIGETFYEYKKIHSFSIIYMQKTPLYLRLFLNKKGINKIDLIIDKTITYTIQENLKNFVKENPQGEISFFEKCISKLKL